MYRTDKQFMKDPTTAHARIYIGNIAETVVADNLEQKFKIHGKILGLVLQRGFGFIQYQNEFQAKQAIDAEHGAMFHGRKLNVKQAYGHNPNQNAPNKQFNSFQPPNNPPTNQQYPPHYQNFERPKEPEREVSRPGPPQQEQQHTQSTQQSPMHQQQQPVPPSPQKTQQPSQHQNMQQIYPQNDSLRQECHDGEPPMSDNSGLPSMGGPLGPPQRDRDPSGPLMSVGSGPPPMGPGGRPPMGAVDGPSMGPAGGTPIVPPGGSPMAGAGAPPLGGGGGPPIGGNGPPMSNEKSEKRGRKRRRGGGRDRELDRHGLPMDYRNIPYYGRDENYSSGYAPPILDSAPERNDCEIIVVSKTLTEYAEYIEQRLKNLGLIVDLLFPNEDVPIGRVLANISSRGCLYAILIMPQNEEHRSLTLDILHGIPQEHRNMPIEDALVLITRNFDAYMRGEQTGRNANGTGVTSLSDRHPEGIQMLFNLLAENRQITTAQYDRLIKYLLQRRDLQSEHEITESADTAEEEPTSKQTELQNRILNILNNKASEEVKQTPPPTTPPSVAPTPLLNDPSVQKALDSLLLGDMFKSIGSTA